MKTTAACPKCSSKQIAIIPSAFWTSNVIKIDTFGYAKLTRYICTSCGYLEQYVADEKSLTALRRKNKF